MPVNNIISPRLLAIVSALPLKPGLRVLEIGCGPGAAARQVAGRLGNGYILGIDRSRKAIDQAIRSSQKKIEGGTLNFRVSSIEDFELDKGEKKFDIAFAVRVGALDGRYPEAGKIAFLKIKKALKKGGKLFLDTGDPLKEVDLNLI